MSILFIANEVDLSKLLYILTLDVVRCKNRNHCCAIALHRSQSDPLTDLTLEGSEFRDHLAKSLVQSVEAMLGAPYSQSVTLGALR